MSTLETWRREARATRAALIAALAGLTEADLARPWPWRGRVEEVRHGLLRVADDEEEITDRAVGTLAALGWRPSGAHRLLGLAEISRGQLLAALVGVDDSLLDREPAPGEWPLRTVLAHMWLTERRYWQRTVWHIKEARAGRPTTGAPPAGTTEELDNLAPYAAGTLAEHLDRAEAIRAEVLAALGGVADADLDVPSGWSGHAVDVRFRLHRLAAHERQHTVQVIKTPRGVGFVQTEAHLLLGQAEATRGALLALLVGVPDALLERAPTAGSPSLATLLADLIARERERVVSLRAALDG